MNTQRKLAIYDNGGKTLDRYTIVDLSTKFKKNGDTLYECIGASQDIYLGVYLHCDCQRGRHLGKRVEFTDLDIELQKKICEEFDYKIDGVDYLANYWLLPSNVEDMLNALGDENDYPDLEKAVSSLNSIGWTFDYGLDAVATNLRPI